MSLNSLSDLTRNSFQSGIPASKWLSLCKLYITKSLVHVASQEIEVSLSNSVLALFRDYPGEPVLQAYLEHALRDGVLSLPIYVTTFLAAARSVELHNVSTLDLLCRVAQYHVGMPLVAFGESPIVLFNTVQDAMALVKTACTLPSTHYHGLTDRASDLLCRLLEIAMSTELTNISTVQMQIVFNGANETLVSLRGISPHLKSKLEDMLFHLYDAIGDDSKAAREAQMMQTLQLALGKGDVIGANFDRDIISCGLMLEALVAHRANDFGSGDGRRAVVLLIALVRWAAWTPSTFYTQLLQAAVTSFAQHAATSPTSKATVLWRMFVIGRLPQLLVMFEKAVDLEGTSEADWRPAMHTAVTSLIHQPELLSKCDTVYQQPQTESSTNAAPQGPHFIAEFLHQLLALGLLDQTSAASINPTLQNDFHPRIQTEAQEHGSDMETYLESRLGSDVSTEDMASMIEKVWRDPCSHSTFAEIINRRFGAAASSNDIEALGHVCKMLYTHEHALQILSLHVKIPELVAHSLAIVEDYDCETVGDPQTAVTHYGNLVLFLQVVLSRFNLGSSTFAVGERILTTEILNASAMMYRTGEYKGEDISTLDTWTKTLFDSGSEGIEDSILRSTRPRSLLRMAATLLAHAIAMSNERKLDKEAFKNGISYFSGPLLNWTLVGVIKALVRESSQKAFIVTIHLEVLQTLLQPRSCPEPVLRLSAANILRVFPTTKGPQIPNRPPPYDPAPIRKLAMQALRIQPEEPSSTASTIPMLAPDPVLQAIRTALSAARAGKAPALDVERCLLFSNATRFLTMLWRELSLASTMGELEAPRRIATFVLSTPRAPRSPPLLPIFLHVVLPNLVTAADHLAPTERSLTVELLVAVISSALMAALYVEWALLSVCKEQRLVLGQPALTMARRLSGDLRRRTQSPASGMIVQRLASSSTFMANFPTFMAEM